MIDQSFAARRQVIGDDRRPAIDFAFWNVRADIVLDNVARYATETGDTIGCIQVDGQYEDFVAQEFARGRGPDVFYAQRAEASLWDSQGHIAPLDEAHPALAPLLSRMDRRMVSGARNANGGLLGLTYYNGGPFALFVHERFARDVDFEAFATWEGILDQLRCAKRDGWTKHPFLPRWHRTQTGLVWSLLCHLATEGILRLDEPDAGRVLEQALGFFLALIEEGLVPIECLSDRGDGAALQRWVGGAHIMTFTTDYLARDAADMARQPVSVPTPRLPGRTGTPLMPGHALLCVNATLEGRASDRTIALLAYLGGPLVHRRWLQQCLFGIAYREPALEAGAHAAMATAFPAAGADASVAHLLAARAGAVISPPTHASWMLAWTGVADAIVRDGLLYTRRLTPAAASDALLAAWFAQQRPHG